MKFLQIWIAFHCIGSLGKIKESGAFIDYQFYFSWEENEQVAPYWASRCGSFWCTNNPPTTIFGGIFWKIFWCTTNQQPTFYNICKKFWKKYFGAPLTTHLQQYLGEFLDQYFGATLTTHQLQYFEVFFCQYFGAPTNLLQYLQEF